MSTFEEFEASIKAGGGRAFPFHGHGISAAGMSLRDYIAISATEEDVSEYIEKDHNGFTVRSPLARERAKYAYADAMLEARKPLPKEAK